MDNQNQKDDESLISHLEALREALLKSFISLGIIFPFAWLFAPKALDFLVKILVGNNNIILNYFSPTEVFLLQIKLALVIDLLICFPYISKKIWDFILPALYEKEKEFIKSIVLVSSTLFIFGIIFCLFVILPQIINFGLSFSTENVRAMFGISNIVTISLWLSVVFGLMFQTPLITHYLIKSEIVSRETIAEKRPYVVVGLLIIAAISTPPDIVSQVLLFTPTYLLFELGLLFSKKKK